MYIMLHSVRFRAVGAYPTPDIESQTSRNQAPSARGFGWAERCRMTATTLQ